MVIMPQIESNYFFKRVKNDKRTLPERQKTETLPLLPCKSCTGFNLKQRKIWITKAQLVLILHLMG